MFSTLRSSAIGAVCALALLATACGGGSGDVTTASTADEPSSEAASGSSSDDSSDGSSDESSESPLADLVGIPFTDDEAMQDYFNDLSRVAEAETATCMLAQGFEYRPVDYSVFEDVGNFDEDTREFAEQYGFGITSNPFEESFEAIDETFVDPNMEYVNSLSAGEQEAYQTALIGQVDVTTIGPDFEPEGCQGDAYNQIFAFDAVFEEFEGEFEALEEAYEADPRIVEATSGWASCIAEAGYNYADVVGAEDDFGRRYDAIVDAPGAFDGDEGSSVTVEGDDGEEDIFFGPGTLNPEAQAQVDGLAVEERAVATASWDCNGPLREIQDEVQLEYETRFVEENGAAISAALAE